MNITWRILKLQTNTKCTMIPKYIPLCNTCLYKFSRSVFFSNLNELLDESAEFTKRIPVFLFQTLKSFNSLSPIHQHVFFLLKGLQRKPLFWTLLRELAFTCTYFLRNKEKIDLITS